MNRLLLPTLKLKLETKKSKGLYPIQLIKKIFKFKLNSGTNQEVWGVYIDFQSIHSKCTIDAILQHMGFYATTENPCMMRRENHNKQSSKYIIIYQDDFSLYQLRLNKFCIC